MYFSVEFVFDQSINKNRCNNSVSICLYVTSVKSVSVCVCKISSAMVPFFLLARRERIPLAFSQGSKSVVNIPVVRFICPNGHDDILHY